MRSKTEIFEQIDRATETNGNMHGMTYEEGVKEALLWAMGESQDKPIEDE